MSVAFRKKVEARDLEPFFLHYQAVWNRLVDLDRSGTDLKNLHACLKELDPKVLVGRENKALGKELSVKCVNTYMRSRTKSRSALRKKNMSRLDMISFDIGNEFKTLVRKIRTQEKRTLFRSSLFSLKALKKDGKYYYSYLEIVDGGAKEAKECLGKSQDVGLAFDDSGLHLNFRNLKTDETRRFHIPSTKLNRGKMNEVFNLISSLCRRAYLSDFSGGKTKNFKQLAVKKGRARQAEGAIVFDQIHTNQNLFLSRRLSFGHNLADQALELGYAEMEAPKLSWQALAAQGGVWDLSGPNLVMKRA